MRAFERRTSIVEHLKRNLRVSTRGLSERFGVSEVTIRSDLASLASSGWLRRRHGGAEFSGSLIGEQPFAARRAQHTSEKMEIALAAARRIGPGAQIMLDGSTTAYRLAHEIRNRSGLSVITNNMEVAALVAEDPGNEVILIGGALRAGTWSTVGLLAEEMLAKLHAPQGFFGAAGLTLDHGFSDADIREVQVKRGMVAAVDEANVLLDSTKFGRRAFLTFAELSQVASIYTDEGVPEDYRRACREMGIELQIV